MSGATERRGESPARRDDARSEFDRGYHEGLMSAYREVMMWSDARLGRIDPGKNKKLRDEIELAKVGMLHRIRHYLPAKYYPDVWQ